MQNIKISKIEIENFKGIRRLTLDLNGLMAGTYQIEADCSISDTEENYEIVSLEKATVVISGS